MWLEAILTREDLCEILLQFVPLQIRLGESGDLVLDGPLVVSLAPERGISVACHGKLHWPMFGVRVPATLPSLVVWIQPAVEARDGEDVLVFKLQIERAHVALLPTALDDRLTALVNEELVKRHLELAWAFGETLNHSFALPVALQSAAALGLQVVAGTVKVTEAAVGFAVSFKAAVQPRLARAPAPHVRPAAAAAPTP